jgi:hypothetical protein
MKKYLIIVGIVILNTPAAFAYNRQPASHDSQYSVSSSIRLAGKFDLGGRSGVPPGTRGGLGR